MSGLVMFMGLAVEVIFGAGGTLGVIGRPVVIFALTVVGLVVVFAVVTFVVVLAIVIEYQNAPTFGRAPSFCCVVQKIAVLSKEDNVAERLVSGEAFITLFDV